MQVARPGRQRVTQERQDVGRGGGAGGTRHVRARTGIRRGGHTLWIGTRDGTLKWGAARRRPLTWGAVSEGASDNPAAEASGETDLRRPRPAPRRLALAVGAAAVAAVVAVTLATRLDDPVGEGAVDAAQPIVAGPVVAPGAELTGDPPATTTDAAPRSRAEGLPIALVLDRLPPDGIGDLPAEDQIPRLRALSATRAEPRRLVELGAAYQGARRNEEAREAFINALRLDPDDVAAEVGLALNAASENDEGVEKAAAALADLAERHPDNQIVLFNQGWLALRAGDADTVASAWEETARIDADSRLGRTATALLAELRAGTSEPAGNP